MARPLSENDSPNAVRPTNRPPPGGGKGSVPTSASGLRIVAEKQRSILKIAERSMPPTAPRHGRDALADRLISNLRQRATLAEETAKTADTMEESEARLDSMRKPPAADARLGALILRQAPKFFELARRADGPEGGTSEGVGVPREPLFEGLRALGLVATDAELAALLGSDETLDPTELRAKLKGLQATAAAADGAVLAQVKTCAVLRRAFQMQHNALQKALLDDETDQLLKLTINGAAAATPQVSSSEALGISARPSVRAGPGAPPAVPVASSRAVVALAGACRSG
jgi:hypothetical protein